MGEDYFERKRRFMLDDRQPAIERRENVPPEGKDWKRVKKEPPPSTITLRLPVEVTDGHQVWATTTNCVPSEDGSPLWWRFTPEAPNG